MQANRLTQAVREALELAYRFMLKGIVNLSDVKVCAESSFNKIEAHREIVGGLIKDATKRRLPPERRAAHLTGEADLREPFERLVSITRIAPGIRDAQRPPACTNFLIDEATELSGAERVLLVLESPEAIATGRLARAARRGR